MLSHLSIQNFAVVRSLNIELQDGLTVITGETGAGKSIMVDALGLVLGDRADLGVIRDGEERAQICAVFDIGNNQAARDWLQENALESEECIIRRTLTTDGRSKAFINDAPTTLQQIKTLGELLLDIHSQHEHQSLLKKQSHRQLLDAFAGAEGITAQVHSLYQQWQAAHAKLALLTQEGDQNRAQADLLDYQIEELAALNLHEGESQSLSHEQSRLANAEQTLKSGQQISALCGGDTNAEESCLSLLNQAIRLTQQLKDADPNLAESNQLLQNARIQLEEAQQSLNRYLEKVEINPQRLEEVEQRLSIAFQLARKHRIQPQEIPGRLEQLRQQRDELGDLDSRLAQLEQECQNHAEQYQILADQLSTARQTHAAELNRLIDEQLAQLGMPGSRFQTALTRIGQSEPAPYGKEDVEFLVSANPGQTPRPLQKVASGGELSRISLAIQVILAAQTHIPTLIFDEVDVGIGGATAEVVGQMLREIGKRGQVLCVTHQPQVAAQAHHHLRVSKHIEQSTTDSQVNILERPEKIREVARMLGGIKLTEQTLAHAEEMIQQAATPN